MGNIDDAVPFFGQGFNKIYPLIMVVYTLLVASNFFDRVIDFFGSWKRLRIQKETDNMDGFDPSGMIILQKGESLGVFSSHFMWYISRFLFDLSNLLGLHIKTYIFIIFQSDHGLNKGVKLASMLSHWQEIFTIQLQMLNLVAHP